MVDVAAAAVGAVAVADGGRRRNWRESLPSNRSPRRGYNGPSAEEERGMLEGVEVKSKYGSEYSRKVTPGDVIYFADK